MGAIRKLTMIPLAGLALACGRSEQPQDQAMNPALRSDLESAAAPTSALASSQFRPAQVVSAIELGESPKPKAPERTATPARHSAKHVKAAPAPSVKSVNPAASEPAPEPVIVAVTPHPAPSPAPATAPVAGPRPTPNPVIYPAPEPEPRSGIGVIIRGGGIGDDDHCEIHPGRGSIPIMINQRIPVVIRTTFPRGGW